jgi:hypothetical protein
VSSKGRTERHRGRHRALEGGECGQVGVAEVTIAAVDAHENLHLGGVEQQGARRLATVGVAVHPPTSPQSSRTPPNPCGH